ncbi:kinase-like domain-containing protein [Xylariales sp. PMI_506]|nr:kinase-like domain-containing protein [Xylariales sp. PMI_506]
MKRAVSQAPQDSPEGLVSSIASQQWQPSTLTEPPRKLRRRGSRLVTVLRSLTNSGAGSIRDRSSLGRTSPLPNENRALIKDRSLFKKFSFSIPKGAFGSADVTVVRRQVALRPCLLSAQRTVDELGSSNEAEAQSPRFTLSNSNRNSIRNTNSSSKYSGVANTTNTTAKTSPDSKFSQLSSSNSGDKKVKLSSNVIRRKEPESNPQVDSPLKSIAETVLDEQLSPTIKTVERAAAAKIYLETFYNEILSKLSARTLRLQYLEAELYYSDLSSQEKNARRREIFKQETDHLRESRVLKARSFSETVNDAPSKLASRYEILKILGKGSFGVVRLVRQKTSDGSNDYLMTNKKGRAVFAMKVIRKSTMLKTSQEGHLRAERDFLVSSEGSKWIVPLVASFQDLANLYLMMEYMPGGDFLGLLIRENILSEPVAKFYIAEMILCIEEAHSLRCIHRDIKPDNFLVSATGHLKISDFGLAFDGHWSHDTSYYHTQRYSLVQKLGISVEGDATDRAKGFQGTLRWAQNVADAMRKHEPKELEDTAKFRYREPLLNWRNRCGNRTAARSVWSLGIILYECLYGHTPFLPEEGGRQQTKRNIVNHKQTFAFPSRPLVSRRCMDLMTQLICEKETRLCSQWYQNQCKTTTYSAQSMNTLQNCRHNKMGRAVYTHDAEDIKAHKWFRDIPWDRLHTISPPFVPQISSLEDTHYFDDEDTVSDWSESQPEASSDDDSQLLQDSSDPHPSQLLRIVAPEMVSIPPTLPTHKECATGSHQKATDMQAALIAYPRPIRTILAQFVAKPYDSIRLKRIYREIDHRCPDADEAESYKKFVRRFGWREKKRPRDRLLRDRSTKKAVLEIRKQSAFLGYSWTRTRPRNARSGLFDALRDIED